MIDSVPFNRQQALDQFPWLQALSHVNQDPHYHGEGDVLTHTWMVVDELRRLPAWQALAPAEQSLLLKAALFHDIGKEPCTKIGDDGRIHAPNHAKVGAQIVREKMQALPLQEREMLVQLVRHHGLPLWFFEKPDPEKAVVGASWHIRLDWVAMLAEADVRGRICPDQAELLERIAYFRQYATELGCYTQPKPFANNHTRFRYFRSDHLRIDDVLYDDTDFEVIMMSGLPGAGKDTWISLNHPDLPVVSLDRIRHERRISPTANQGEVVSIAKEEAKCLLRRKQPFIWNATNLTRHLRDPLVDLFASYGAHVSIVYIDAPLTLLLSRNRSRKQAVPAATIRKLLQKLEVPTAEEAHQVRWIESEQA